MLAKQKYLNTNIFNEKKKFDQHQKHKGFKKI